MEPRDEFANPGSTHAANAAGEASGMVDEARRQARGVAGQARRATSRLAGRAREQADEAVSRRKDDAAGRLDALSGALHDGAQRLGTEDDVLARYANTAADGVDRLSRYLRESDPEALLRDVEGFARRRPELFVGGTFVAGLLLARFLKSTSGPTSGEPFEGGQYASTGTSGYVSTDAAAGRTAVEPDYPEAGSAARGPDTGAGLGGAGTGSDAMEG